MKWVPWAVLLLAACATTQSTGEFEPVEVSPIVSEPAPAHVSEAPQETDAERPEVPSRADVARVLTAVAEQVAHCGAGVERTIQARFRFDASGHVRAVEIPDVPPDVRACMEPVAESARLPPFRRPEFTVSFPFRLH